MKNDKRIILVSCLVISIVIGGIVGFACPPTPANADDQKSVSSPDTLANTVSSSGFNREFNKVMPSQAGVPEVFNRLDAITYTGSMIITPTTPDTQWRVGPTETMFAISDYTPIAGQNATVNVRIVYKVEGTLKINMNTIATISSGPGSTSSWETQPDLGELDKACNITIYNDANKNNVCDSNETIYYDGLASNMGAITIDGVYSPGMEIPVGIKMVLGGGNEVIGDTLNLSLHTDMTAVGPGC